MAELKKPYNGFKFQETNGHLTASISFAICSYERDRIVQALEENGIETRIYSAGNIGQSVFWKESNKPFFGGVAQNIHQYGLFLPNFISLTEEDIIFICDVVKKAIKEG